jgi:Zn-dependent M28 family amino/carboxypeptidase
MTTNRLVSLVAAIALAMPARLGALQFGTRQVPVQPPSAPVITALDDIRQLSDDKLGGRMTGSLGADSAAAYIARRFEEVGLQPSAGGWFQTFTVAKDAPVAQHTHVGGLRAKNVIGLLPGRDPVLRNETLIVGAHYDHLGLGGFGSLDPDSTGQVHNGADDNASGVAALLELARAAARAPSRLRRSLVFVAFAGEELGLRGSEQYTAAPPIALDRTRAVINLDMVGRARGRVLVGAFGRLPGPPLLPRLQSWTRLAVQDFARGGYSEEESDVGPFAKRGVPAVAFFTGFHSDYHRPTDDWPAVDADGGAAVAELALKLVEELAR